MKRRARPGLSNRDHRPELPVHPAKYLSRTVALGWRPVTADAFKAAVCHQNVSGRERTHFQNAGQPGNDLQYCRMNWELRRQLAARIREFLEKKPPDSKPLRHCAFSREINYQRQPRPQTN